MKVFASIAILLMLSGCGEVDRAIGKATGFARTCADGVMYYQFASGAAPAYTIDGKLRACK